MCRPEEGKREKTDWIKGLGVRKITSLGISETVEPLLIAVRTHIAVLTDAIMPPKLFKHAG